MAKAVNPAAPKPQSLGTRLGKFVNKLQKLEEQRDRRLRDAPAKIEAWFDERRADAIRNADDDVLERLGVERP